MSFTSKYLESLVDDLDSVIFTGDHFYQEENLNEMLEHIERWKNALECIKDDLEELLSEVENYE